MKIPGVYVEIKGDATQLKKEMAQAKEYIASQATGISNALNNALYSGKINTDINKMVQQFGTLNRSMKLDKADFGNVSVDLKGLTSLTGLTEQQFGKLQSRMLQTQAAKAQEAALKRIASACNLTEKEVRELGTQFGLSSGQINKVVGASKNAESSLLSLGGAAKGMLGYFSAVQLAQFSKEAFDTGVQVDSLNRAMLAISGSQSAAASEMSFLSSVAEGTGQNMYKLADGYKQLSAATKDTELEGAKTKDVFLAISEAAAVLGLSQDRVSASIVALSQMASKGTVQMEELKGQLGDHIPGAVQITARAMGVTTEKLMEMGKEGKLLASEVLPALARELHILYGEAAQTAALESGQAAVNQLSQAWTGFKSNIYESSKDVIIPSIQAIASALNMLSGAGEGLGSVVPKTQRFRASDYLKEQIAELEKSKSGLLDNNEDGGLSEGQIDSVRKLTAEVEKYRGELERIEALGTVNVSPSGTKKQITGSAELEDGRKKLLSYIQTREQKITQDYDEAVKFAQSIEEIAAAAKVRDEALSNLNKKSASSGLKAERSALKELNAEITGYTAEAREAADAADKWHQSALDSLDGMGRLNDELAAAGLGEFGQMAFDAAQQLKEGTKEIEAYQLAVAQAGNQITITGAAYDKANEQLNKAKAALAANGAGSDTQDANKVRALEKEVEALSTALKDQTADYYNLNEAQKQSIQTVEDLKAAIADQKAFSASLSAYQQLGVVSQDFFSKLEKSEQAERDKFIELTGDKDTAARLFYEKMLEYRTALATNEYEKNGSVSGLMQTGLENYKIEVDQDAITFYSDLFPNAIDESTEAMAEFFSDIAQGNATLSESWKSLGESVEDTVFGILQDLLQLQLKMVVLSSLGLTGSGATTGGGVLGMISGLFHTGGVVGSEGGARAVSPSLFTSAPRYHTGLQGNEFPAILKKGESVLTEGQMAAIGKGLKSSGTSQPNINVIVNNAPAGTTATVQQSSDGLSYDVIVEMVEQKMQDRVNRGRQAVGKRAAYL